MFIINRIDAFNERSFFSYFWPKFWRALQSAKRRLQLSPRVSLSSWRKTWGLNWKFSTALAILEKNEMFILGFSLFSAAKTNKKKMVKMILRNDATTFSITTIDIKSIQNRLLKVCYVPATSAGFPRLLFLLRPLTVLMKQTRQAIWAVKQSIILRFLW